MPVRYQLPYLLARFCGFYSSLGGILGIGVFIFDAPLGLIFLIPIAIYGISCHRFNGETKNETMRFYMYYQMDKSAPKLRHSHSKQLRRRAVLLAIFSWAIVLFVDVFGILAIILVEPEYTLSGFPAKRENIFFLAIPVFTLIHGGQAIYCRMVYRSLQRKK